LIAHWLQRGAHGVVAVWLVDQLDFGGSKVGRCWRHVEMSKLYGTMDDGV
jgi:hypothetical protein